VAKPDPLQLGREWKWLSLMDVPAENSLRSAELHLTVTNDGPYLVRAHLYRAVPVTPPPRCGGQLWPLEVDWTWPQCELDRDHNGRHEGHLAEVDISWPLTDD
jgi:hypothetical protein